MNNTDNKIIKMKKLTIILLISCLSMAAFSQTTSWKAQWVTASEQQNETNNWTAYNKTFKVGEVPDLALAKIACDSKYWMWINGELAVF